MNIAEILKHCPKGTKLYSLIHGAPWYKKEKFNPKTLKPFDKVLARLNKQGIWYCELLSFVESDTNLVKCCGAYYQYCIPYNEDTKHLVGTTDEAPEYYRYWED